VRSRRRRRPERIRSGSPGLNPRSAGDVLEPEVKPEDLPRGRPSSRVDGGTDTVRGRGRRSGPVRRLPAEAQGDSRQVLPSLAPPPRDEVLSVPSRPSSTNGDARSSMSSRGRASSRGASSPRPPDGDRFPVWRASSRREGGRGPASSSSTREAGSIRDPPARPGDAARRRRPAQGRARRPGRRDRAPLRHPPDEAAHRH